ncbi:MAG: bifunctional 5,10-methylenetetrahydrofolate dehydrogenase/5,10-methenyltetrahydrofolate cyclohydrolase [Bacilli bacterium]|nr:bifunctional 5,10-methylenetetrahydrofolate dehydrogenase/5,10-methenyltetrahydrofolate cyclohydrolase [Bacilli bacterium]
MVKILDGKKLSLTLKEELKSKFDSIKQHLKLAIIMPICDDASIAYLNSRERLCKEFNIELCVYKFDGNETTEELVELVKKLNLDDSIQGIMIDRPFPKQVNEDKVYEFLDYRKDIDGCSLISCGKLFQAQDCLVSSTAVGVMTLLKYYNIDLVGKNVVIVNRSKIVGIPLMHLLLKENSTVTICHSKTKNLARICSKADIIITAIGKAKYFTKEYVNAKTTIIDVGINYDENNKICGDVDQEVYEIVDSYSPVPGGVGPVTNIALLLNLLKTFEI